MLNFQFGLSMLIHSKFDIVCIEDLIHEIYIVGLHIKNKSTTFYGHLSQIVHLDGLKTNATIILNLVTL